MMSKLGEVIAKNKGDAAAMPDEALEETIRLKAYALYEARGCAGGHDLEDWLQAETECRALYEEPDPKAPA